MLEPPKSKRWYEQSHEQELKFKFVLTPRGKAVKSAVPMADEEGRTIAAAPMSESGMDEGSSKPAPPMAQEVSLAELARDPAGLQKLLACTMFLMKDVPQRGQSKRLDLGVERRGDGMGMGMRGFEMKHGKGDAELDGQRVRWKVSLR